MFTDYALELWWQTEECEPTLSGVRDGIFFVVEFQTYVTLTASSTIETALSFAVVVPNRFGAGTGLAVPTLPSREVEETHQSAFLTTLRLSYTV